MKSLILLHHPPTITPSCTHKNPNNKQTWRTRLTINAESKGFTSSSSSNSKIHQIKTTQRTTNRGGGSGGDEKVPDAVWERMISRILVSVGLPLGLGVALLQVFDIVKENHLLSVPVWLPYFTTFLTFGCSALGIAYGTLSTSWDVEREGSLLGFEEARRNWDDVWREDEEST